MGVAFYNLEKNNKAASFSRQIAAFTIGLPVYRSGPYFDRNTIRLGGTAYQKSFFKVQPELYMNGFFKKVYPGLRLVVGLWNRTDELVFASATHWLANWPTYQLPVHFR